MSSTTLRYIEPTDLKVRRREGALHLDVKIEGADWMDNITVKRAFPLSKTSEFLSILDSDGKEIGILSAMEGMDPESYELLAEELDRRYFTPHISQIHSLKQEAGMWKFVVQTQRGPSEFFVRNWRDSAYEIVTNRWQITSVDGGRYEIIDLDLLDKKSQKLVEQLL